MSGLTDAIANRLRCAGRIPSAYVYELDGWIHCRECWSGVPATWEYAPKHAASCSIAKDEAVTSAVGQT